MKRAQDEANAINKPPNLRCSNCREHVGEEGHAQPLARLRLRLLSPPPNPLATCT